MRIWELIGGASGQARTLQGRLLGSARDPGGPARDGARRASAASPATSRSGEIGRAGVEAMHVVVERLGIEADHVVFGHIHRRGPLPSDDGRRAVRPRLGARRRHPPQHRQLALRRGPAGPGRARRARSGPARWSSSATRARRSSSRCSPTSTARSCGSGGDLSRTPGQSPTFETALARVRHIRDGPGDRLGQSSMRTRFNPLARAELLLFGLLILHTVDHAVNQPARELPAGSGLVGIAGFVLVAVAIVLALGRSRLAAPVGLARGRRHRPRLPRHPPPRRRSARRPVRATSTPTRSPGSSLWPPIAAAAWVAAIALAELRARRAPAPA